MLDAGGFSPRRVLSSSSPPGWSFSPPLPALPPPRLAAPLFRRLFCASPAAVRCDPSRKRAEGDGFPAACPRFRLQQGALSSQTARLLRPSSPALRAAPGVSPDNETKKDGSPSSSLEEAENPLLSALSFCRRRLVCATGARLSQLEEGHRAECSIFVFAHGDRPGGWCTEKARRPAGVGGVKNETQWPGTKFFPGERDG